MRGRGVPPEEALESLAAAIADELSPDGWQRRRLEPSDIATLTLAAGNGVLVAVVIRRAVWKWPDNWPAELRVAVGVGYEPALALMPLLTLRLDPILIPAPDLRVSVEGPERIRATAAQIVEFVRGRSTELASDFPDASAIAGRLEERRQPSITDSRVLDASNRVSEHDLVLLAAMGRPDEARALLADYRDAPRRHNDATDRRFARQLTRWLDVGCPVAPPIEETLARLPQPAGPRRKRPTWATARADQKVKNEARDAARARSDGLSREQLEQVITEEYRRRGLTMPAVAGPLLADRLELEKRPFGRARAGFQGIQTATTTVGDLIRMFRNFGDLAKPDPAVLRLPERASYQMVTSRSGTTSVELDTTAQEWIERLRAEPRRRIGPIIQIKVWLTRDESSGRLIVHSGQRRVGLIRVGDEPAFEKMMAAAAIFDEDPFVIAAVFAPAGRDWAVLEVPLPDSSDPPTSGQDGTGAVNGSGV